ncbi:MAG TPA: aldehyde dehydrogenase family protein, partial [bacterium]|nr:aldehyde dehydrogenase family protein [bacterium]
IERVAARVERLKVGHPLDPATEIGPLIHQRHLDKVLSYFKIARDDGARIRVGGARAENLKPGLYVQPTLLTHAKSTMRVAREEIFGPVLTVLPFEVVPRKWAAYWETTAQAVTGAQERSTT